MRIENDTIFFTNADPLIFDGLGEIEWQAPVTCAVCGASQCWMSDSRFYDGCLRELPYCTHCNSPIKNALPTNEQARKFILDKMETRERERPFGQSY